MKHPDLRAAEAPVERLMADDSLSVEQPREPARPSEISRPAVSPLKIYKPGQGKHVRWGSAIGAGVIAVAGVRFFYEWLRLPLGDNLVLRTLIPVAVLAALGWLIFWLVFQKHTTVDFMIATEGEMKKVNWSSRKEVLGATKVVIFTVLALGFLLFIVDTLFMLAFSGMGVLKIPLWKSWFGMAQ
ncbi:MAG: preprotein translocase subunit SecE [Phycisphaerae bacterium]|nr:preprotein translocase subunit SecE [Phycisphaerae bacterium]